MQKLDKILSLVSKYIRERQDNESWTPGKDWIQYSGPNFNEDEYLASIKTLLSGWLIFGENCRKFEEEFPKYLGKKY